MKTIRVEDQPRLHLGRTLRITLDGIRYRLFRSLVTVCVIAVAVAFLMNILSESLMKRSVATEARARLASLRVAHHWSAKLSDTPGPEALLRALAGADPGGPAMKEMAAFGKLDAPSAAVLQADAAQAVRYLDFLDNLDYARRRTLCRQSQGAAVFDAWSAQGGAEAFLALVRDTPSVRFPGEPAAVTAFAARWPRIREQLEGVRAGWKRAVSDVRRAQAGRSLQECLASGAEPFAAAVRSAGFVFAPEEAAVAAAQAERILDAHRLERALEKRAPRQAVARHFNILPGDVTVERMWRYLGRPANAAEYLEAVREHEAVPAGLTPARLAELAGEWRKIDRLEHARRLTAGIRGGWLGLGPRMGWLLAVSMLVCGIGISNAMLMTVTERFREIATLKCLGALDGFIMLMFILESCVLGVVGGVMGGILGGLLGTGRVLVSFGPAFLTSVPAGALLAGLAGAVTAGVALAGVAAVYPSFRAARLAPMEAMRVE